MNDELKQLQRAVKLVGVTRLAERCGVKPPTIYGWYRVGRAPAERVLAIEAATAGEVSRHQLRPDIYPEDRAA